MRVEMFACAESAVIDQGTNRLSVFNFLEDIFAPVFPLAYPQATIAIIASREETEPSTFDLNLRLTSTVQEQPLLQAPLRIDFQSRGRARVLAQIAGLPVPGPGRLRFSLLTGDDELAAWEVAVIQVSEPRIVVQPTGPTGPAAPATPSAA
jgi:hypothetical protein